MIESYSAMTESYSAMLEGCSAMLESYSAMLEGCSVVAEGCSAAIIYFFLTISGCSNSRFQLRRYSYQASALWKPNDSLSLPKTMA